MTTRENTVIYDVAKFLKLCAGANPTALEILFAGKQDWLYATETWRRIHAERYRFLTKKVQATYVGYGIAQLNKIRTRRAWLVSPPAKPPSRADFGLSDGGAITRDDRVRLERAIAEKVRAYGIDALELPGATRIQLMERLQAFWSDALNVQPGETGEALHAVAACALQLPQNVLSVLAAERRYRAAVKLWESYQTWQKARNPLRADVERRFGYDTKMGNIYTCRDCPW